MPPALQAVMDGRMVATVRNPSCLIQGGAIIAGVASVVSGEKTGTGPGMIPKQVVMDGPVVNKANVPGLAWMEYGPYRNSHSLAHRNEGRGQSILRQT